jgi:hypothetical protein
MRHRLSLAVLLALLITGWQLGAGLGSPDGATGAVFLRPRPDQGAAPPAKDEPPPKPPPVTAPKAEAIDGAIRRGVAFLLQNQNKDGSWGTPHNTKLSDVYLAIPGAHHAFRAAVTSLCISALIESGGDGDEVRKAVERGEAWLFQELPKVRRANPIEIYNVWTHAYGIQALVRMHARRPDDKERRRQIEELIRHQIGMLERFESIDGGWGYYDFRAGTKKPASDSTSFTTAAALVAFHEAKQIGVEPPAKLVKRAIDSILRQRKPDFSYLYGEYLKWTPMHPINRPGGSLGRSQCCNLALRLWGDKKITDQVLAIWLDRLFARNLWLDMGRKRPIPHESYFAVAGYFFFYGHYYAALCLEQLKPQERPFYQDHLAHVLIPLQEKDGSWWDFPMYNYHQPYGTAFALMSLKRCRRAVEAPAPSKGE